MLFEIGVIGVIVFALAYWTTLFIMGRREDVLHGEFVEAQPELASAAPLAVPPVIFPPRPVIVPKQVVAAPVASAPPLPAAAPAPEKPADTEALRSLLVSLKQELKNAAQI